MATAGTLISDLEVTGGGGGDGDLVHKILADMNIPTGGGKAAPPPPMPAATPMEYSQQPMSTQPHSMDGRIPTSHMIGNEHPSPADFAAAMVGMSGQRASMASLGSPLPGVMGGGMASPPEPSMAYEQPQKNFYGRVVDEIKVPFMVAILFFIFSLSPIRVLVGHYVPSFLRPTGEYHVTGLLVIAAVVGLTFWILQRVVAPLLSI